jgi:hypothetical protein
MRIEVTILIIKRYDPQSMFDTLSEAIDWAHDFDRMLELNELIVPNNRGWSGG